MAISVVKVKINGVTQNLTYNSSTGAYEGSITAPSKSSFNQSGGYYDVEITAIDDSGNDVIVNSSESSFGDDLKLYVRESVAPTIEIVYPTTNAILTNNKPTFSWQCSDNDSGINKNTIELFIDGKEVGGTINASQSSGVYTCTYVPTNALADGEHIIKYQVYDNDGNVSSKEITLTVDTVAPTLTVSQPSDNAKVNTATITVSGYTNDLVSSPVSVTVNGKSVEVDSNGYFSTTVTLSFGDNNIVVISKDSAGKSTTITRTVNFNNKPPVIESLVITPNPVSVGAIFNISAVVTDE